MKEIDERMVSETMSGVSVERDFLGIDSGGAAKKPIMERKKSFRELHGEISKMNPDVIKSVIATSSAAAVGKRKTPLPVLSSASRSKMETAPAVAPFTIFYNGAVVVFDLPREKAENILKLVEADKFGDLVHASKEPAVGEELDVNGG